MPENIAPGINVSAPVSATGGDRLGYTPGGTDEASFDIVPDTGQIRTVEGVIYDYETQNVYRVEVAAQDDSGNRKTIDVAINLLDRVAACGPADGLNLRTNRGNTRLALRWSPVRPVRGQQGAVG